MIIQFKVANYRSIGDEQTLSFVAENARRHPNNLVARDGYKLLKSVALFGANASGKSNLVKAMGAMQEFVRDSATRMNEGDPIKAAEPFRLDPALRDAPSRFEITFVTEGIVYVYGFAVTRKRVDSEWMISTQEKSSALVCTFTRTFQRASGKEEWVFDSFKDTDINQIQDRTLENMLALSVGAQQKVEALRPAYRYLREQILTLDLSGEIKALGMQTARLFQDSETLRHDLSALLSSADTGIEDIKIEVGAQPIPDTYLDMPEPFQEAYQAFKKLVASTPTPYAVASRRDSNGSKVYFDFEDDESQGTQRFFAVAGPILKALEEGICVVIDELDASMHPLLTRRLLELFQSAGANSKGAQLLFTTHDSSLLDQDLFRRDQIWLAEKRVTAHRPSSHWLIFGLPFAIPSHFCEIIWSGDTAAPHTLGPCL